MCIMSIYFLIIKVNPEAYIMCLLPILTIVHMGFPSARRSLCGIKAVGRGGLGISTALKTKNASLFLDYAFF